MIYIKKHFTSGSQQPLAEKIPVGSPREPFEQNESPERAKKYR